MEHVEVSSGEDRPFGERDQEYEEKLCFTTCLDGGFSPRIANPFVELTTLAYDALNREILRTLANGVVANQI